MSDEKKLNEKPTSVPRGSIHNGPAHSPQMEEIMREIAAARREADRIDREIEAEAARAWADIVWPEESFISIGPPEEKEEELAALREDIARRKAALENANERSSEGEEKENSEDE